MTCDTRHLTLDAQQFTNDSWGEVNLFSKIQLPSSYGLGVKVEDISTKDERLNELMNDKGVYGTAPAILGLLITFA